MAAAKFSIKTASSFFLVLYSTMILFFALPCFSSDPDPLQDFCVADLSSTSTIVNGYPCKPVSKVTSEDFFYSGLKDDASTLNSLRLGLSLADVKMFPGLNTLGLSLIRIDLGFGGIVPLHVHPRASEATFVIKGEVLIGFISTDNVLYSKVVKEGEMAIIPRGLVHFTKNVGPRAVLLSAFNSHLPGTALIPDNLFGSKPTIPNDILAKNFRVNESVIASIKSEFGDDH